MKGPELRIEDCAGWEASTYPSYPPSSQYPSGPPSLHLHPRTVTIGVDLGGKSVIVGIAHNDERVKARIPLAVVANLLRLAGWGMMPPGYQPELRERERAASVCEAMARIAEQNVNQGRLEQERLGTSPELITHIQMWLSNRQGCFDCARAIREGTAAMPGNTE